MPRIFIVRHGQDTDNENGVLNGHRDTDLTDLGRIQAREVAQRLKDKGIVRIYVSPLKRALDTATIIADILGIDCIIIEEDLIERNFGILTGKRITDIPLYTDKILVTTKIAYFLEVEDAEDFTILYQRAEQVLLRIKQRQSNYNFLIVTHGDIGKMIQAAYYGWTWRQGLEETVYFANTDVIELPEK